MKSYQKIKEKLKGKAEKVVRSGISEGLRPDKKSITQPAGGPPRGI